MKKLVALLLALCLMCGGVATVAETPQTMFEANGHTFALMAPQGSWSTIGETWSYYETSLSGLIYFHDKEYVIIEESLSQYTEGLSELPMDYSYARNNGERYGGTAESRSEAAFRYMWGNYQYRCSENVLVERSEHVGMFNGEPVFASAYEVIWDNSCFYYNIHMLFCYEDVMLTVRYMTPEAEERYKLSEAEVDEYLKEVGVLISCFRPVDMSEEEWASKKAEAAAQESILAERDAVRAETEAKAAADAKVNILNGEKEEVKLGNVTFKIPAGLEEIEKVNTSAAYESDVCSIELVTWAIDNEVVRFFMKEMEKAGAPISFQEAATMFVLLMNGFDEKTVAKLSTLAVEENIGMLSGKPILNAGGMVYAHAYRDNFFMVMLTSETLSAEETEQLAEDIMLSARIDGISEEDMIADAQADYVIITADSGKIRTEASISGGLIKTAYKGETYELIEESGDWYVIDVDGRTGYLHSGVAEIQ